MLVFLHVSEVGCPAAGAASGSGPEPLPPAPTQSAQCNAVRDGPAERRLHPGRREMQTSYKQHNTPLSSIIYSKEILSQCLCTSYYELGSH